MADNTTGGSTPGSVPIPRAKRGGLKGFWNDVSREMKKVNWPSRQETNRLTGVVLAVCILMAVVLVGLSYGFETVVNVVTGVK